MLGLPAAVPILLACIVIPAVNYVVLGRWVFRRSRKERRAMSSAGTSLRTAAVTLPGFRISLTLAVLFIGAIAHAFNAWRWGTIPDTSWLITVAERVASGERLFVDVIELNPPFSIWLYMGPVRLAMLAGVAPESVVRVYTMLICLAGSALAGWMLASSGMLPRRRAAMVSVALFAVAVLLPGNSFSERDQIGAVLGLPLLDPRRHGARCPAQSRRRERFTGSPQARAPACWRW